ncbi:hypothetical protein OUZ56_030763 [Daphnia magna]|uniref:Uncharacterized protein n=1 Tax=Daphnia magna TaxID=35525 RepID=A0ABQ9ZS86_9CRUS|nr:hypothetical protein OUZ56_030763 [Daphnia magna]
MMLACECSLRPMFSHLFLVEPDSGLFNFKHNTCYYAVVSVVVKVSHFEVTSQHDHLRDATLHRFRARHLSPADGFGQLLLRARQVVNQTNPHSCSVSKVATELRETAKRSLFQTANLRCHRQKGYHAMLRQRMPFTWPWLRSKVTCNFIRFNWILPSKIIHKLKELFELVSLAVRRIVMLAASTSLLLIYRNIIAFLTKHNWIHYQNSHPPY